MKLVNNLQVKIFFATFWAYQQKAAAKNTRKYKPIFLKLFLLQRYNRVKSENMLFLHDAILI